MTRTDPRTPMLTRLRRTPREWRALIRAHACSDQSRKAFCAHHGVALSTFDWWRRRLREGAAPCGSGVMAKTHESIGVPTFIELTPPPAPVHTPAPWDIELDLGAGMVLRLRRTAC
jgi:transposase-like protein